MTLDTDAKQALIRLCHHGWVIPVVVHLGRGGGGRLAVLKHRLEVARTTVERALVAARELNLVMRNPGHGHPLRPEYLLTPQGESIAPACERVVLVSERLRMAEPTRKKWTLPVLASLEGDAERFTDLQRDLPSCSPRALAHALAQLEMEGCVIRDLVDERPPRPTYRLSSHAEPLARAAWELAKTASGHVSGEAFQ